MLKSSCYASKTWLTRGQFAGFGLIEMVEGCLVLANLLCSYLVHVSSLCRLISLYWGQSALEGAFTRCACK